MASRGLQGVRSLTCAASVGRYSNVTTNGKFHAHKPTREERQRFAIRKARLDPRPRLERIYRTASKGTRLYMRRHATWCAAFSARLVALFAMRAQPLFREVVEEGVKALQESGYRSAIDPKKRQQRTPDGRVRDMLRLPAIQQNLEEKMVAAGFGLDRVAEIMAGIANGNFEDAASAAVQLKALELRMKITTGFAPAKSANLHRHETADNFFDNDAFESAPPIDVTPR